MRIISGTHRGRRIQAPKKLPIRPTTDMAKEGLFNILQNRLHIASLSVLDLFSGSGNISYEFASRGADDITAIDQNMHCVQFISKTSKTLGFPIKVIKANVFGYLKKNNLHQQFIFADPPYILSLPEFEELVDLTLQRANDPEVLVVIEHADQTDLSTHPYFDEERKYGGSVFSFFKK